MRNGILILILGCLFFSCVEDGEDSIRLIPKGYEGPVLIVFNQSKGKPKEYENGKRVYRISENGILETPFEPNYGIQKHQYFYIDKEGNREQIPFIIVEEQDSLSKVKDRTKVYAFGESAYGKGIGFEPDKGNFTLPDSREFYIGNLLDIEKSYNNKMKFSRENIEKYRIYENK